MSRNAWHFITRWRVEATPEEVYSILSQPADYPRWWPSVYLDVRALESGGSYRLLTKGWLPYRLRWTAHTMESQPPHRLVVEASGDFNGRGIWSIVADGAYCDITFDWKIRAEKPLLRYLTPVLRPVFEANHRWAMAQGEQSLRLELERSRAWDVASANAVAAPPARASLRGLFSHP